MTSEVTVVALSSGWVGQDVRKGAFDSDKEMAPRAGQESMVHAQQQTI